MGRPPELWAFVLANAGLFVIGCLLTALSYVAYRQSRGQRAYRIATIGFGFVVLGGLVSPAFQFGTGIDYTLNGNQILLIEAFETCLLAIGLGLLFYSITRYDASASPTEDGDSTVMDGEVYGVRERQYGD